jgi:uroporphyrinogen-III synthase
VSLTIHLLNETIGERLQHGIRVARVYTEDEVEGAAEELDESPPSDAHVAYPRHTSLP